MSDSTYPMFGPDGQVHQIPQDQAKDAMASGGKFALRMLDPQGQVRYVPHDQFQQAMASGGKVAPEEAQDKGSFWRTAGPLAGHAVAGMIKGALVQSLPPLAAYQEIKGMRAAEAEDKARAAAGHGLPYRMAAGVASKVGVNVSAMEQAADEGRTNDVWAQAAVPAAAALTPSVLGHALPPAVRAVTSKLPESPLKTTAQAYLGIGKRFAENAATDAMSEHQAALEKTQQANAAIDARHEAATQKFAIKKEQLEADTEKANIAATKEHTDTVARIDEFNKAGQEGQTQRAALAKKSDVDSAQLGSDVKALEQKVRATGSGKFQTVTNAVGDTTVPADNLASAVAHAQKHIINGSTESIKQFSELTQKGTPESVQTSVGKLAPTDPLYQTLVKQGAIEPGGQLSFRDLQGYYTELGQKMQGAGVPGDVYRALKYVRNAVGTEMQTMANAHGVGPQLTDARVYWKQYESTFHDTRALASGGSPVARIFRAADPAYARDPLLGKASTRAVSQLSAYDPQLAARAASISSDYQRMHAMPAKFTPKATPAAPEMATAKVPEAPVKPARIPMPEAPDLTQAVRQAREQEISRTAERFRRSTPLNMAVDVGTSGLSLAARRVISASLDSPKNVEWLTAPEASDLSKLNQLPSANKARVAESLTQTYIKQAQNGRHVPIADSIRQFLSPEQVKRIEATGSAGQLDMQTTSVPPGKGQPTPIHRYDFALGGKTIGNIQTTDFPAGGTGAREIQWSGIEGGDIEPGKGFGGQMYRQMIQQMKRQGVKTLYSDAILTPASRRVWESLRRDLPVERVSQEGSRYKLDLSQIKSPAPAAKPLSGADRTKATTAVMMALKSGQITPQQADSQIQKLNGGGGRKLLPPPQSP